MSEQPFDGVTVLELGQFVAVPWAGQVLADGGAHVIKIEPPEGEPSRHIAPLVRHESRHFVIRNRGKHSLPLDLKHADAREILDRQPAELLERLRARASRRSEKRESAQRNASSRSRSWHLCRSPQRTENVVAQRKALSVSAQSGCRTAPDSEPTSQDCDAKIARTVSIESASAASLSGR